MAEKNLRKFRQQANKGHVTEWEQRLRRWRRVSNAVWVLSAQAWLPGGICADENIRKKQQTWRVQGREETHHGDHLLGLELQLL